MKTLIDVKRFRAFKITYYGATDYRGSRISIYDIRNKERKIVSWDYEFDNISDIATEYLTFKGIKVSGGAYFGGDSDILFTDDFETSIK